MDRKNNVKAYIEELWCQGVEWIHLA